MPVGKLKIKKKGSGKDPHTPKKGKPMKGGSYQKQIDKTKKKNGKLKKK